MGGYKKLFDAFGPTALGQTVAAMVIGALMFDTTLLRSGNRPVGLIFGTLAGAALGFIGAVFLILTQARRKRVKDGLGKPHGPVFWILVSLIGVVIFIGICNVFIAVSPSLPNWILK